MQKCLVSIVGATGIGKTALAIDVAQMLNTEILSCDSRQFFKEMKIGTAAPTPEELEQANHHFIGHLSVSEPYSIGKYETEATNLLNRLFKQNQTVVLVGGSMMYEKAVIDGLNDLPEASEENLEKLTALWKQEGIEALQNQLKIRDSAYFNKVDIYNPRRLIRALDVIMQTGKTYTELIEMPKTTRDFKLIRIGIEAHRNIIYERINRRVDAMIAKGLLNEVTELKQRFLDRGKKTMALNCVGYNELFRYIEGEISFECAVEEIKKNTRRFAKRQLTWYRKEKNIHWVNWNNSKTECLSLLQTLIKT